MTDDDKIIIESSFNKIKNNAQKAGYRDGISQGRDLNFQKSFDDGYMQGFKNGFILGLYKGVLSFTDSNFELDKTSRGNCNICKTKIDDQKISEIIRIQTDDSNELLSKLHEKNTTEIYIPNKII